MNKNDFQQLNDLKTPEKWLNNAINIPNKKNNPKPFLTKSRIIAFAAVLVVAVAVGVTVFSLMGRESKIPSKPIISPTAAQSTAPTEAETDRTSGSEASSSYETAYVATYPDQTAPSAKNVTVPDNTSGTGQTAASAVTEPYETVQSTSQAATVPVQTEPREPYETIEPDVPTESPWYSSDDPGVETEPDPYEMLEPNDDPDSDNFEHFMCVTISDSSVLSGVKYLYCHIINGDGYSQTAMYTGAERFQIKNNTGLYNPAIYQNLTCGSYTVVLYDKNGTSYSYPVVLGGTDIYITIN